MGEVVRSPFLSVAVRDREKKYFLGEAASVSSFNDKGPFDILPQHANFISMIKRDLIIRKDHQPPERITIEGRGVLRIQNNQVEVYLGL